MNKFSDYFKNKKDKDDFFIALVVIGFFIVGGSLFASNFNLFEETEISNYQSVEQERVFESEEDKQLTTTLLADKKNVETLDNWLKDESKTNNLYQHIDTITIDSIQTVEKEEIPKTTIIDVDTTNSVDSTTIKIEIDSTTLTIDSVSNYDIETQPKEVEPTETVKEEVKDIEENVPSKVTKPTPKNYNCVIVVGAFTVGENADKLKNKLVRQGYPAYTFFRKGNKVVGIKQSCDDEKAIQKILSELKKTYSNAWILRNK